MKFRFLRDPLFLLAVALYFTNRLVLRPLFPHNTFLSGYVTDLLCLPVWVPLMVWLLHKIGLRDAAMPCWSEVFVPLVFWSLVFEFWLPHTAIFGHFAPGDPLDVAAYTVGGVMAFVWWQRANGFKIGTSYPQTGKT